MTTGATPLHDSCRYAHIEIVKALLAVGANITAKTIYGDTALSLSINNGHAEIAQLLMLHD
jgi:ankyrin repeat protein